MMFQEFLINESQKFNEQITQIYSIMNTLKFYFYSLEDSCKDLSIYL